MDASQTFPKKRRIENWRWEEDDSVEKIVEHPFSGQPGIKRSIELQTYCKDYTVFVDLKYIEGVDVWEELVNPAMSTTSKKIESWHPLRERLVQHQPVLLGVAFTMTSSQVLVFVEAMGTVEEIYRMVKKKIEVVEWHRHNGKNVHATARHFNLDRKRIREWEKKYEISLQQNFGKAKLRQKLSNGAPVFSEEVDDALFEFLERERSAGRAVSNRLLSEEAVKIAHSLQLGNFPASSQHIKRWKQRFGVTMCHATNESQKTPEDLTEAAKAFRSAVNALRIRHDYTLFNISNMDQTMVRMDSPANRTNNVAGESTVRIANTGCARRGFTVALAACASGHKLPAFVILKEPSRRIPPKALMSLRIPANVRVTGSKNGWMTSDKLQEWLSRVWGPNSDDVRRLLVLDQAPIHKSRRQRMP
ncbi:hypothetical protein HPB50_002441 [Hyalomma asiaticum]|uniref:Uncharacterized protein n=1 Tax=Hyalomma asiaticum TaxID=266040 RepID=A0ACB7SD46_HYAAI|nr:hypothetical protein HPB50_002441 [Hyalomma asiaticum]